MTPFVVFALPRSRTYWLSRFLQYGPWQCGHEQLRHCRSLEDVRSWLSQPYTGTVETAAAPFWRLVPEGVRIVTLRRPVDDVLASHRRLGLDFDEGLMRAGLQRLDAKLDQIERRLPDVLSVRYEDLDEVAACEAVFEHCLRLPFDSDWWAAMAPLDLQANIWHFLRYAVAHAPQTERLRRQARHEMFRRLRRPVELDGITFQRETLHAVIDDRDAERLLTDHSVMVAGQPDAWRGMNVPLLERIEAAGNLHIYTARSNGRLFGYVMAAVGEAFLAEGEWEADELAMVADPSFPGLGRQLQVAAVDSLRSLGITRLLLFQHDGSRIGALYRRVGARQTGQRYVLELQ